MAVLESVSNSEDDEVTTPKQSTIVRGRNNQPVDSEKRFVVVGKPGAEENPETELGNDLESVIGDDDRKLVSNTTVTPWNKICALRVMTSSGVEIGIGTGWFAGPRTIVTAGHMVHNRDAFGGWASRIEVIPGRNGFGVNPFGVIPSGQFSSIPEWISGEQKDFDIGCVHLNTSFPDGIGWFAYGALTDEELTGHSVNVSGYPRDRGAGAFQFHHANRIREVENRRLYYDVDTNEGQSGAPVFITKSPDLPPIVVGIHAYGVETTTHLPIQMNSSPRILSDVFDLINGWVAKDTPPV